MLTTRLEIKMILMQNFLLNNLNMVVHAYNPSNLDVVVHDYNSSKQRAGAGGP